GQCQHHHDDDQHEIDDEREQDHEVLDQTANSLERTHFSFPRWYERSFHYTTAPAKRNKKPPAISFQVTEGAKLTADGSLRTLQSGFAAKDVRLVSLL